jgi:MoxR-like ATPase
MDMHERVRFTADEITKYLINRLERENAKGRLLNNVAATAEKGQEIHFDPFPLDQLASELLTLVDERQRLLKQTWSDQRFLEDKTIQVSQNELLDMLDRIDGMEDIHLPHITGQMDYSQSLAGSVDEAMKELSRIAVRIGFLLAEQQVKNAYFEKVKTRIGVIRAARNVDHLNIMLDKCHMATMRLITTRNNDDLPLTSADIATLKKYDVIAEKIRIKINETMGDEGIFYETKRRTLLAYRRQLMTGGFVKTATIKDEIMRVLSHLHLGIPVFLRGHLGVGKTELALHVCREYLGMEPEFISGSEEATKYDIYGRTQIGVTSGLAGSYFQEGPLVRAMKEGKPLIIDEMDGIPHSIIMRMNHVLTRRHGDKITIQESGDEEITVKKGFCVIATGNVKSARYKREELDAAFLSRWWSEDITYPPQQEAYEILTAALIDHKGDLQMNCPKDIDDLKRLTEVANEIQQIFTGEHLDYLGEGADAARGVAAGLRKSVLSLRHLWNIVRPWKAHNFDKPMEHYILNEFIRPAVAEDQVYLVQLFCRYRFFKEWSVRQLEIPGLTETKLLAFQGRQPIPT